MNDTISFDIHAPSVDYTECPTNCPERHRTTHVHCASDGAVILAGGDGRRMTDYENGYECHCCTAAVCTSCARHDSNDVYCIECFIACRKDPRIDFLRAIGSCWPHGAVTA